MGITDICLNTPFVNCNPPFSSEAKWRKEEEPLHVCTSSTWVLSSPEQVVWCLDLLFSAFHFLLDKASHIAYKWLGRRGKGGEICLPICGSRIGMLALLKIEEAACRERDFSRCAFIFLYLSLDMMVNFCMYANGSVSVWLCVCSFASLIP